MNRCLFLVEGPYDMQRLTLLKSVFDERRLEIFALSGDKLTTKDYYINYASIIKQCLDRESTYSYEDFDFIAQVCDTDGCFIPDNLIYQNEESEKIHYFRDHIEVKEAESKIVIDKNKRENIERLLKNKEIELFYNSCNIDDAFNKTPNPSRLQKRSFALTMYNKYRENLEGFIDLMFEVDTSNTTSYQESWDYIKKGINSLQPTSNLKYFLINHMDDLKEPYKELVKSKLK